MTRLCGIFFALLMMVGGTAKAGERLVVVELYTSQGCSSCPPADALFSQIKDRSNVLALALHVDYWDYLGWKDEFADPAYTARQKNYAREHNHRSVYTPQMVVEGEEFIIGTKPMDLADAISAHQSAAPEAQISTSKSGNSYTITVSDSTIKGPMKICLVTYEDRQEVKIRRGENAGRTLAYHNIVTSWTPIGEWNGQGNFQKTIRLDTDQNVALLVQEHSEVGPGRVAAAARIK